MPNNRLPDKDLLYFMELGMLQRLGSRYDESQKAWMAAEARIAASAATRFAEIANLVSGMSSYVLNDKLRAYQGHDYERVMLLTYMALNHLARGDYERARVAIRQTHEFEAQIAELRAKQYAEVEEEAKKRGARTSVRELNGYPVETIDNAEVNALRNSYQSALSHYLAGFVYEALGEAEPRGAGLPPRERAAARPAAAGGGAARARRAHGRAGRRHDRRAVHHRHRHRARPAVAPVRAAGAGSRAAFSCCRTPSRSSRRPPRQPRRGS